MIVKLSFFFFFPKYFIPASNDLKHEEINDKDLDFLRQLFRNGRINGPIPLLLPFPAAPSPQSG